MSKRYKLTAGGSEDKSTLKLEFSSNSELCKSEQSTNNSVSGYKSRLRPRPTRQTDHYHSPAQKRRKSFPVQDRENSAVSSAIEVRPSSTAVVHQTKTSILRQNSATALKSGSDKRQSSKTTSFGWAAKRARSEETLSSSKKQRKKILSKLSTEDKVKAKGKEISTKLWYPFIAPVTSSDSEEEDPSALSTLSKAVGSSSATTVSTRKLASKSSKSSFSKGSKEKNQPSASSSKTSVASESSGSKLFSSKSSTRFSFSRFSKSDSKNSATEDVNKEAGCSQGSGSSTQSSKSRSSSAKHLKGLKGKSSSKSKNEETKAKSRKRYQSPPNHPLYNSRVFSNSNKTGSCASTSRKGRGKSSRSREEPGPSPDMSREADRSPDEADDGSPGSEENQQGASQSAAAADDNANANVDLSDPEMSRLQALLEARGLPSHFFGALGPRVQQILHRSVNSSANTKSQQLLQGMQATGDESRQLQSVIEMCQLLVMGNEDTLSGFPVKMSVPVLITLLKMEHNFDIMNHACRALTYMMEALPRSSGVVVDAVPVFLEKLQSIQCMDVAEQSLTALEMLSRRHSAAILRANGLSSCLLYLDFFSLPAQRNALAVAANCCVVLTPNEHSSDFEKVNGNSISMLVQRLSHHDKKCVESICLCFARLIDNFRNHSDILQVITNNGLLENFQNLLIVTPPLIGSNTFVMVIRTMCLLCSSCPNLATQLVRNNIAETLRYLLCGAAGETENVELVPRSPQELYEITSLIGELMPRLPLDDPMFGIDRVLKLNSKNVADSAVSWQWRDDNGSWKSYSKHDSRMIEESHRSGDNETGLLVQGRAYMIDFNMMQQINEDTGNSRSVRRQTTTEKEQADTSAKSDLSANTVDARVSLVKDDHAVISQFVRSLFTVLYEVYGSSAGSPAVRHKCLRAVQRMIYYAEPELLRIVLKNLSVSSHIASMLSSNDLKVVVGALQMSMILMKKLPDVFEVYFRRQGVTHQVEQLLDEKHKVVGKDPSDTPVGSSTQVDLASMSTPIFEGAPSSVNPSPMEAAPPGRLSDILRRKYPSRKTTSKRLSSSSLTPTPEDSSSKPLFSRARSSTSGSSDRVISPPLTKAKAFAAALSSVDGATDTPTGPKTKSGSSRSTASSFFYNLNPVRWGRASSSNGSGATSSSANSAQPGTTATSGIQVASLSRESLTLPNLKKNVGLRENREEVKQWIREQAKMFLDKYFTVLEVDSETSCNNKIEEQTLLKQLTSIAKNLLCCTNLSDACENLRLLSNITATSDVSSFELQHSGIISSLITFLTQEELNSKKEKSPLRKVKSATTPPMVTRRQFKLGARKTPQAVSESEKGAFATETRPKYTVSDQTGHFVTQNTLSRTDYHPLIESESSDCRLVNQSCHPVVALARDDRLRHFLYVFVGLPDSHFSSHPISVSDLSDVDLLRNLVEKLNLCISQLEQFAVRSHDLPTAPDRGSQALNFFAKHQLKCQLQRHPDCSKGKQWHSGPVRVDPLALVQAIERYLITRGYGTATNDDKNQSDKRDIFMLMEEEDSEDDIEVDDDDDDMGMLHPLASGSSTPSGTSTNAPKHRLELYVGSHKLPYNMTVYQAVKHYSESIGRSPILLMSSDRDTDDELLSVSSTNVWNTTHTIYYKLLPDLDGQNNSSGGNKKSQKVSPKSHKRNDALYQHGIVTPLKRPLDRYLNTSFSAYDTIKVDPSKEVLCLMRVLFGLTVHWHSLYSSSCLRSDRELLPKADYVNSKLSVKAHRQLQDPLMIMTGELPPWLSELAHSCSFVLSFETRQLLFRIVSFDRDRAMQYLYDIGALPDTNTPSSSAPSSSLSSDTSHRFVPKIEKKKCVVKRESLLHQAEKILQDYGNSRSLLEVQYEGEVGTGLGPTLEFYTLTSHELQKVELGLWRSDEKSSTIESNRNETASLKKLAKKLSDIVEEEEVPIVPNNTFVHSPVGLYPIPIGRSTKFSAISKVKNKFRFLGKLLAKSAMDGRMVDIPLSIVCYKWLLGKENEISWFDLEQVDPVFTLTFNKLKNVFYQKQVVEQEAPNDKEDKISSITMDGCSLEDLGLDFLLPGFPNFELMKGGSKTSLSINNIDKYLSLIAHWTLMEGVHHQLEALRDGFQSVFPLRYIDYFFPEELDELFCGARYQPWTERELADCCLTDHGYSHESEVVKTLFRVLSQYDVTEQRSFLQFVTGSPHLPVGGLRALHPQLTIVRKSSEEGHSPDEYLPSVMTCVNYLKLPEYSSEAVMRQRLAKAAREGQKSFLLS